MVKPTSKRIQQLRPGQRLRCADYQGHRCWAARTQDGNTLEYIADETAGPVVVRSIPFPGRRTAPPTVSGAIEARAERDAIDRHEESELAEIGRPFSSGRGE